MDLAGHTWTFSESIADVAPEEWRGTTVQVQITVTLVAQIPFS